MLPCFCDDVSLSSVCGNKTHKAHSMSTLMVRRSMLALQSSGMDSHVNMCDSTRAVTVWGATDVNSVSRLPCRVPGSSQGCKGWTHPTGCQPPRTAFWETSIVDFQTLSNDWHHLIDLT